MTHQDIAATLRRLLDEEQFDEAEQLLPRYAQAVTEECISAAREPEFQQARDFIRETIEMLRARRAHMVRQITESDRQRAYLGHPCRLKSIDIAG